MKSCCRRPLRDEDRDIVRGSHLPQLPNDGGDAFREGVKERRRHDEALCASAILPAGLQPAAQRRGRGLSFQTRSGCAFHRLTSLKP